MIDGKADQTNYDGGVEFVDERDPVDIHINT